LFEMMVALGLLATFALVATKVLTTSTHVTYEATGAQNRALRFESVVGGLRRDVWRATRVEVPSATTVRLTHADGSGVVWTAEAGGGLARTRTAPDGRGYPPAAGVARVVPPA
jgi:hypothetical protein